MIELKPLVPSDREQFIKDNQEAFNYGALVEFGRRDEHFEEDEQIISRKTIERSIDGGEAYRIVQDGQHVGGVIIQVDGGRGELEISLFLRTFTAKASAMLPGVKWKNCTRK